MKTGKVIQVIAITAVVCLITAGILFYILYRFLLTRRLCRARRESSFRRELQTGIPRFGFGGAIRGVVVDEEGLDVMYLRKVESGRFPRCFSHVWVNPMVAEVKRMTGNGDSEPVPDASLLQETELLAPPPPPPPVSLPPPPPPPPEKTKGKGLALLHKPPPIVPNKGSLKENVGLMKLKPLHWEKVHADSDRSMVWNEISDGSFRFDDDLMEALFSYTPSNQRLSEKGKKVSSQGSSYRVQSSQTFILEPRKSQNTAIVLKSLTVSHEEIIDALLEGRGLSSDTLEKLNKIRPTEEEMMKLIEFSGNPLKLADAESFLYYILKAVPSAFIRINAMLFRLTYDQEILHVKESLQFLELACQELRSGGVFFKLLEAILKAGNLMNAGTKRGNAQGFDLTALRRLSDVKSTNGKTTLLHFVVEQVIHAEGKRCLMNKGGENNSLEKDTAHVILGLPALESLSTEFSNVKKAASLDYDSLFSTLPVLIARIDEIKQLLARCRDNESSGFVTEMEGLLENCQDELIEVIEQEKEVLELVRKTTVYYRAGNKGGNPLQLFVLVKDFLNSVDQVCAEIAKNLQKTKVEINDYSSPPLSPPTPRSPVRFENLHLYIRARRPETSSSDSEDDL